jgi:hypothetical protein
MPYTKFVQRPVPAPDGNSEAAFSFEILHDGCEASPSCFTCPLPDCVWEPTATAKSNRWRRPELRAAIWRDYQAGVKFSLIVARACNMNGKDISERVVSRIIREEKAEHGSSRA